MSPERWQQIAGLFDEVLEQEPPQRAAFLNEACAGDTELRREVESLIAARDRAGSFLRMDALDNEASQIAASQTAFLTGQQIAHFEVLSPLGAGAMGEVYLARDTRLDRKVALKLLPVRFTLETSRLRRFEREARAASSLNHPNIITVYEVGSEQRQDGDRHFIATEFVEGKTLRQHLSSGPLALSEVLNIAIGIAAALEAAHTSGIVHRDIKPENVMVRPDGVVKVLDFGIAKLTEKTATDAAPSSNYSTEQGTVIGTPGYMSPEQARGLDVDARTDIFSLGVVLYEMIAGHAPFGGVTHADVIVSLLEKEPPPLEYASPGVAEALNNICQKALAKNSSARYRQIAELQEELRFLGENLSSLEPAAAKPKQWKLVKAPIPFFRRLILIAGITLLTTFLLALAFRTYTRRTQERVSWANPANWRSAQTFSSRGEQVRMAVSPNGEFAAFSLNNNDGSSLWIRRITTADNDLLPPKSIAKGKWRDRSPVWSPDGQRLAFLSDRSGRSAIWTQSLSGAQTTMIRELDLMVGALVGWRKDQGQEVIYYESLPNLYALDISSSQVRQLTHLTSESSRAHDFSISPDGRHITYIDRINDQSFVMLKQLPDGVPIPLTPGEKESYRSPSWFPDGNKIAYAVEVLGKMQIGMVWLDSRERVQITSGSDDFDLLRVLPNGKAILALSNRESASIFSCDLQTGVEEEQSSELGINLLPEISFDGSYVAFKIGAARVRAVESIFVKPLNQATGVQPATLPSFTLAGTDARWSPNNDALAFIKSEGNDFNLWKVSLSDKKESLLASKVFSDGYTRMPHNRLYTNFNWSPDGTRLLYISNKSGHQNLWVVNSDGSGNRQLSNNLDPKANINSPVWSPVGRDLAYLVRMAGQQPETQINQVYVMQDGIPRQVFERDRRVRIIGWLPQSPFLLLALGNATSPQEVELVTCPLDGAKPRVVARLTGAYPPSLRMSKDRNHVAFVTRHNGVDNIEMISVRDWSLRKVTENRDQTLFYSGLDWHSDTTRLSYSRQTNWAVVSLIEKIR